MSTGSPRTNQSSKFPVKIRKRRLVKKRTETILVLAKAELKRLGSVYTEGICEKVTIPEYYPEINKFFNGINWEKVAIERNIVKRKPSKANRVSKARQKNRIHCTKRNNSKGIVRKEKLGDVVKLTTFELLNNDQSTQHSKAERNISDLSFKGVLSKFTKPHCSIESDSAHLVSGIKDKLDAETKYSETTKAKKNIESLLSDEQKFKASLRSPDLLLKHSEGSLKKSSNHFARNINLEQYAF